MVKAELVVSNRMKWKFWYNTRDYLSVACVGSNDKLPQKKEEEKV